MCLPMVARSASAMVLIIDRSTGHHRNLVRQIEHFIEVLGQQQHGRALVALLHDLRPDFDDRGEIEPEAWIGDNEHIDVAG